MRTFCLLLILANILFLAWSQLIAVRVSAFDRPVARSAEPSPRIVLAREASSTSQPPVNEVRLPDVAPLPDQQASVSQGDRLACTSIGPFAELSQSAQAQAALRATGLEPRQRIEEGDLWVGYWVSVQNLTSREQVDAALQQLSDNGVSDVYVMPSDGPANILSLGVFSDYERAQRRADQIRALGLEPRIDDRKRAGSVYWIDVDLAEPGQLIDTTIFQSGTGKIMRLELRACPGSANG